MSEKAAKKAPAVDIKALREARKDYVDAANARLKEQNQEVGLIKKALADGPRTVPELAQATGLPSTKVMYFIASMLKYAQVTEGDRQGAYFKYELVVKKDDE